MEDKSIIEILNSWNLWNHKLDFGIKGMSIEIIQKWSDIKPIFDTAIV